MTTFEEYADWSEVFNKHAMSEDLVKDISYIGLGIAGESGEVVDEIKKIVRDGRVTSERLQNLILELGDQQWYIARLVKLLQKKGFHVSMDMVWNNNIKKLSTRYGDKPER